MGNHTTGLAIGLAAQEAMINRQPGETALQILDRICMPHHGCDVEFVAPDPQDPEKTHPDFCDFCDPHPKAALGMLMLEAFSPGGLEDIEKYATTLTGEQGSDDACYAWLENAESPFRKRYEFG